MPFLAITFQLQTVFQFSTLALQLHQMDRRNHQLQLALCSSAP
jgi:hypothetical protein